MARERVEQRLERCQQDSKSKYASIDSAPRMTSTSFMKFHLLSILDFELARRMRRAEMGNPHAVEITTWGIIR
jgi:hypothetical protein